ncbi:MAG: hypothetical protein HZC36_16440 [Armatimonadetes bacterium]|nr:hypothetical protein [Armatimonadota bacterium]
MVALYNLLFFLATPIWLPWMLWRSSRRKEKPNWAERFGRYALRPHPEKKRIWVHAVSVGEVVAAMPILAEFRKLKPDHEVVLSVTTSSGHQTARERASELYDHLVYFPIDFPKFQLRAMASVRPKVVAVMETELWMNFLWAAKALGAKTLLLNGRISDRSFPRARKVRQLYAALLGFVDRCLMQTQGDAERITALGAGKAEVFGNCKFDQAPGGSGATPVDPAVLGAERADLPVVVVGSTRGEDEEAFVIEALRTFAGTLPSVDSRIRIVWAPRHLERADALARAMEDAFGRVARRSAGASGNPLLLDTYGELAGFYEIAEIAIVGGGFGDYGGQNLIQALAHGVPVLHGPHMQNFREAAEAAQEAGASIVCATPESLSLMLKALLHDPAKREEMGRAARALVESSSGASKRYAEAIAEACEP